MLMYLFEFLSLSLELLIMIMYSHKKKTGKTLDDTKQERYNKRNFIGKPKKRPYLLKLKKTIQKFNYKSDSKRIYHNQLKKACFQCVATYENFKDLSRIAVSDNVLRVKRFEITGDPKYDGYQRWLASMVKNFFVKKSSEKRLKIRVISDWYNKLNKTIIRNFKTLKYVNLLRKILGILIWLICNC